MDKDRGDQLSAVVARQRGRSRLRAATVALGSASLVAAGAVAYTLPGVTHTASTGTTVTAAAPAGGHGGTVHTTSGGSAATSATTSGQSGQSGQAAAPAAARGSSHAVSGGS
ncbi:MAG TPA: hypothetical protein VE343_16165 [Streptosporangiaceae bacterium]|nr:hypothetical protein [Streptosporangiaceae bacterium]